MSFVEVILLAFIVVIQAVVTVYLCELGVTEWLRRIRHHENSFSSSHNESIGHGA